MDMSAEESFDSLNERDDSFDDRDYIKINQAIGEKHHLLKPHSFYTSRNQYLEADPEKSIPFKFENKIVSKDPDEEDPVYPLSKRYSAIKDAEVMTKRCLVIAILLGLIIAFIILSVLPFTQKLPFRIGFFANKLTTETFAADDVTGIAVNTKNCIVHLLEKSGDQIEVDISASWSTDISTPLDNGILNLNIVSTSSSVQCYVELKVPGGKSLDSLSFTYNGDTTEDLMLYDYKGSSSWSEPLEITTLSISATNAYPNVLFRNSHAVGNLVVSGNFCN